MNADTRITEPGGGELHPQLLGQLFGARLSLRDLAIVTDDFLPPHADAAESSPPSAAHVKGVPRVYLAEVLARPDESSLIDGLFHFALNRAPEPEDFEFAQAVLLAAGAGWLGVVAELLRQDHVDRLGSHYRQEVNRQMRLVNIAGLCVTGGDEDAWLIGNADFLFVVATYRVSRGFGPSRTEWAVAHKMINEHQGREWLLRGLWRQREVRERVRGVGGGTGIRLILRWTRWFSLGVFRSHVLAEVPVVASLLTPLVALPSSDANEGAT